MAKEFIYTALDETTSYIRLYHTNNKSESVVSDYNRTFFGQKEDRPLTYTISVDVSKINVTVSIPKDEYTDDDDEKSESEPELLESKFFEPEEVFIGKSRDVLMNSWSYSGSGRKFDGNGCLLRLKELEYLVINYHQCDAEVIKFNAFAPIIYYSADVGNNYVPYTFAIDEKGNVYLFNEDVILLDYFFGVDVMDIVNDEHRIEQFDPYSLYYGNGKNEDFFNQLIPEIAALIENKPIMKGDLLNQELIMAN